MNIDRHNYEEWFLLYTDDELCAADRREVEAFMEVNPDLAVEMEILRQMKLDPSEVCPFSGKASLYRLEEEIVEHEDALLISYLDGELHGEVLAAAEHRLKDEAALAARLEQFRLAVLPAEPMVFTDKASLYRKRERNVPVIPMRWVRIAVAATIILSIGALWMGQRSAPGEKTVASLQSAEGSRRSAVNSNQSAVGSRRSAVTSVPEQPATSSAHPTIQNPQPTTEIHDPRSAIHDPAVTIPSQQRTPEGSRNNVAFNNDNAQPKLDNGLPTLDARQLTTDNRQPTTSSETAVITPENMERTGMTTVAGSDYATQALLNADKPEEPMTTDEEERSRKSPFRGLVRKANRLFNRAASTDPDRATVKVASFEIPLRR